jgi:predicted branched-subunit amino acid permease
MPAEPTRRSPATKARGAEDAPLGDTACSLLGSQRMSRGLMSHPAYRLGAREMLGVSLGLGAWGLVTGVAMVKAGLPLSWAVAMNLLAFSGSAQLAALPLLAAGTPAWVILATCACVNLRFVVFSLQWRPFFAPFPRAQRLGLGYISGDLTYALFMRRYGSTPPAADAPAQARRDYMAYFLGACSVNWLSWQIPALCGMLAAQWIPAQWDLGFAGVLALWGVALSLTTDARSALALAAAGLTALLCAGLPMRLNIVAAIAAAMLAAWAADFWRQRSKAMQSVASQGQP